MKTESRIAFVIVTAPGLKVARALARTALKSRLIACANLIPSIESHYWWQGQVEKASEVLMVLKTKVRHVTALQRLIVANHPYETPEFAVLQVDRINKRYLEWLVGAVQ